MTHLNKPRLELVIDDDVIAVTLKTVLVIVHHGLGERSTDRTALGRGLTHRVGHDDMLGIFIVYFLPGENDSAGKRGASE